MVAGWGILVFVPVIAVLCMAVTVVDVIHMVTVGYGHVATVGAVLMIVVGVSSAAHGSLLSGRESIG